MAKGNHTIYSVGFLILGVIGGIFGTAFSLGADKQRIDDMLTRHTKEILALEIDENAHEKATQKELDRFSEIIVSQMTLLQNGVAQMNSTVSNLRTDVQVLKALIERIESNLSAKTNSH